MLSFMNEPGRGEQLAKIAGCLMGVATVAVWAGLGAGWHLGPAHVLEKGLDSSVAASRPTDKGPGLVDPDTPEADTTAQLPGPAMPPWNALSVEKPVVPAPPAPPAAPAVPKAAPAAVEAPATVSRAPVAEKSAAVVAAKAADSDGVARLGEPTYEAARHTLIVPITGPATAGPVPVAKLNDGTYYLDVPGVWHKAAGSRLATPDNTFQRGAIAPRPDGATTRFSFRLPPGAQLTARIEGDHLCLAAEGVQTAIAHRPVVATSTQPPAVLPPGTRVASEER